MTDGNPRTAPMHYPWQGGRWQMMDDLIERQRLPHALLFCGPQFIGKRQFANALAARLLCDNPLGGFACGRCKQCLLLAAGSHPDLLEVEPEEEGKAIRIDPVRELGQFITKTAMQGLRKVAIIHPAEAMNLNASNALLKNLEEPSAGTHIILVSHELSRLPATIRSRCRRVTFSVPSRSEVENWLELVSGKKEHLAELLDYAADRPLLALRFLESDLLDRRRTFDDLLDKVARGMVSPLTAAESHLDLPPPMALDWLYSRVAGQIKDDSRKGAKPLLFLFLDKLSAVKSRLLSSANPNVTLLWEELMMDWQRLFR